MASDKKDPRKKEKSKINVVDRRHWVDPEEGNGETVDPESLDNRHPSYVAQLKNEAEEKDKRLKEYIAAYKSKNAENDEFRARLQRDNETRLDQIKANFFKKLIPILDNMKRASDAANNSGDFESLKEGIEMILSQFAQELKENGVEVIEARGRNFNPQTDEAFMTVDTSDPKEDNMVVEELELGYTYKDKLLKPVKVKVAKLKTT